MCCEFGRVCASKLMSVTWWLMVSCFQPNAVPAGEVKGDLLALQLTFQLPPSSYVTMLNDDIRELTKMATGTAFHKSLTQVHLCCLTLVHVPVRVYIYIHRSTKVHF